MKYHDCYIIKLSWAFFLSGCFSFSVSVHRPFPCKSYLNLRVAPPFGKNKNDECVLESVQLCQPLQKKYIQIIMLLFCLGHRKLFSGGRVECFMFDLGRLEHGCSTHGPPSCCMRSADTF